MNSIQNIKIKETYNDVRAFSFNEKKDVASDQERINHFLDSILDFKKYLKEKTNKLNNFNIRIEKITWQNEIDDDDLMLLNDLISVAKDLHSTLFRLYASWNLFRKKGIAKVEIKEFKEAVDDFKESYTDLESVFFFLPNDIEFSETTKSLSLL
jgi:hypothetical protein